MEKQKKVLKAKIIDGSLAALTARAAKTSKAVVLKLFGNMDRAVKLRIVCGPPDGNAQFECMKTMDLFQISSAKMLTSATQKRL